MTKLSLLIPTTASRENVFHSLLGELLYQSQGFENEVEVLYDDREPPITIGEKRNALIAKASGTYLAFIDSDDEVSFDYVEQLMNGINNNPDCCSLKGQYYIDGREEGLFEHSLKYGEWRTNDNPKAAIKYERFPNHLNCIKSSIAKQFKFPCVNNGEDHNWSDQIRLAGALKTEHYIENVIYHYKYCSNK